MLGEQLASGGFKCGEVSRLGNGPLALVSHALHPLDAALGAFELWRLGAPPRRAFAAIRLRRGSEVRAISCDYSGGDDLAPFAAAFLEAVERRAHGCDFYLAATPRSWSGYFGFGEADVAIRSGAVRGRFRAQLRYDREARVTVVEHFAAA